MLGLRGPRPRRGAPGPSRLILPFERALGNRRDLGFDGCVALFWNRLICLDFLRGYLDDPAARGKMAYKLPDAERARDVWAYPERIAAP